ncbi:MAG: hypothetical protein GC154_13235 [bacterium]|nr:hypothetical protein [bacterium]
MSHPDLLDQLIAAFEQETAIYQEMLTCSEEQALILKEKAPNEDALARLMAQKVKLAESAERIEAEHQPIKDSWKEVYTAFSDEERARAAQAKDRLMALLERLQQLENDIVIGLNRCKDEVARRLVELQKSTAISKAYVQRTPAPSRFIDKRR